MVTANVRLECILMFSRHRKTTSLICCLRLAGNLKKLIIAVPIAPTENLAELQSDADEVICLENYENSQAGKLSRHAHLAEETLAAGGSFRRSRSKKAGNISVTMPVQLGPDADCFDRQHARLWVQGSDRPYSRAEVIEYQACCGTVWG